MGPWLIAKKCYKIRVIASIIEIIPYIRPIITATKAITGRFGASGQTERMQSLRYYQASFVSPWSAFDKGHGNPTSGKRFISLNQKKIQSKDVNSAPYFWS